jgi:hypothetical protein
MKGGMIMRSVSCFIKVLTLLLVVFIPASSWSQITYNEDLSVRNQFTVEEVGRGDLQPGIYYWLFHHSYRNDAAETNKWDYRKNTTLVFLNEKPMSEDIDTAMTQRARIETLNMLDRNPVSDIAWATEQSKIERKQALFQKNISQIIPRGGSSEDRIYWENIYKSIDCGLQAVKGAYMANSQRKQQYLAIYKDLVQRNNELVDCLCLWSGLKKAQEGFEGTLPNFSNSANIARAARDRWVANMAGVASSSSGSAVKGSSGKN